MKDETKTWIPEPDETVIWNNEEWKVASVNLGGKCSIRKTTPSKRTSIRTMRHVDITELSPSTPTVQNTEEVKRYTFYDGTPENTFIKESDYSAITAERDTLRKENEELRQWKKEMLLVWDPVDEYVRPKTKLGESVSDTALQMLKQRDEAVELLTEFVNAQAGNISALKMIPNERLKKGQDFLTNSKQG